MMDFKIGFCRIESKRFGITHGEIVEIFDNFFLFNDYGVFPHTLEMQIEKSEVIQYEPVSEDDIPAYE